MHASRVHRVKCDASNVSAHHCFVIWHSETKCPFVLYPKPVWTVDFRTHWELETKGLTKLLLPKLSFKREILSNPKEISRKTVRTSKNFYPKTFQWFLDPDLDSFRSWPRLSPFLNLYLQISHHVFQTAAISWLNSQNFMFLYILVFAFRYKVFKGSTFVLQNKQAKGGFGIFKCSV